MAKGKKKYYKALTVEDGDERSWSQCLWNGGVVYKVGEKTTPQLGCGPLAVFGTFGQAQAFVRKFRDPALEHRIYECEITRDYRNRRLWRRDKCALAGADIPEGTVFARSVTLTRRMDK